MGLNLKSKIPIWQAKESKLQTRIEHGLGVDMKNDPVISRIVSNVTRMWVSGWKNNKWPLETIDSTFPASVRKKEREISLELDYVFVGWLDLSPKMDESSTENLLPIEVGFEHWTPIIRQAHILYWETYRRKNILFVIVDREIEKATVPPRSHWPNCF